MVAKEGGKSLEAVKMQNTRKPMPIGVEDFKRLVTEGYSFIDKTKFIKEYIDAKGTVTLITRPRRFGKTLTLSMLRYFFTIENAEENRKLFEGLSVENAGERYMKEQGSRPVVFLTLKDIQRTSYASMLAMLSLTLQELYEKQEDFLHIDNLKDTQASYYRRILAGTGTKEDLSISLKRLMEYLEKQCGTKPILLLDEYDAPILSAWKNGYYDECVEFMRGFLSSALKTNESLGSAVLTGVTRISKESIFSGLNNLNVCSVLSEKYSDSFGLSTFKDVHKKNLSDSYFELLDSLSKYEIKETFGWSLAPHYQSGQVIHVYSLNKATKKLLTAQDGLYSFRLFGYPEDLSFYRNKKAWLTSISHEGLCFLNDPPEEAAREFESKGFSLTLSK